MSHPHMHHRILPGDIPCRVLTVSDSRTPETDTSGLALKVGLQGAGFPVVDHRIVADEAEEIRGALTEAIGDPGTAVVIITGGTGVAPRDVTIEVVEGLFDKALPGFGEIFRALSFAEIGAAAIASRATAGVAGGTLIFATPGSRGAVSLALERLILPELGHLVGQMRRSKVRGPKT